MERLRLETIENIISVHRNTVNAMEYVEDSDYCPSLDKCIIRGMEELKQYRIAEEQGLLLKLPCKVVDTIYRINQYAKEPIISMKVLQIRYGELSRGNTFFRVDAINDEDMGESCYFKDDFGVKVFLTKEEAEQALEKEK